MKSYIEIAELSSAIIARLTVTLEFSVARPSNVATAVKLVIEQLSVKNQSLELGVLSVEAFTGPKQRHARDTEQRWRRQSCQNFF